MVKTIPTKIVLWYMYSGVECVSGVNLKSLPDYGVGKSEKSAFPPWSGRFFNLPGVDIHSE